MLMRTQLVKDSVLAAGSMSALKKAECGSQQRALSDGYADPARTGRTKSRETKGDTMSGTFEEALKKAIEKRKKEQEKKK